MSPEREVEEMLAHYVRAADQRDGIAMSRLFTLDGRVETFYLNAGKPELVFVLEGQAAIADAVSHLMAPHPSGGWSHHTTHGHLIKVDGDHATIDAQFIRFDTLAAERPAAGWPAGAGPMGTVTPTEAGYYQPTLRKVNGAWKIVNQRILHNLPFAIATAHP